MNTKEAIQAMLDGHKVRRSRWAPEVYSFFSGYAFYNQEGRNPSAFVDANDWEIYEAPKPKQTKILYEWLICNELNAWSISDRLRTEEEASTVFNEYDYKSWQKTGRSFEVEL